MMSKTRHIHKRMSQRSISQTIVDMVSQYGTIEGEKIIITKKNAEALMCEIENIKKSLLKIRSKGGIAVVESGEAMITTYALGRYKRSHKKTIQTH